jgi:hypothetical protein
MSRNIQGIRKLLGYNYYILQCFLRSKNDVKISNRSLEAAECLQCMGF